MRLLQWLSLKCSEHQPWQSVATQAALCLTAWVCGEATSTSGSGLSARANTFANTLTAEANGRSLNGGAKHISGVCKHVCTRLVSYPITG